jgi:hypothetical protein
METILLGRGREVTTLPREVWEHQLAGVPERMEKRLAFMTEDHRRVRYLVVGELPRQGVPLSPDWIARELDLPLDRVAAILHDLETNLFFLTRNAEGAVAWAYPLTVERTPHHLSFRSGERLYGA